MATPVDVARIEDETAAHPGGVAGHAARFELASFQPACLEDILDAQVEPWTTIAVIYDQGSRREGGAERCRRPWTIAQRRTAEERQRPGGVGHKPTDDRARNALP